MTFLIHISYKHYATPVFRKYLVHNTDSGQWFGPGTGSSGNIEF